MCNNFETAIMQVMAGARNPSLSRESLFEADANATVCMARMIKQKKKGFILFLTKFLKGNKNLCCNFRRKHVSVVYFYFLFFGNLKGARCGK